MQIENPSNQGKTARRKTKFMLKTRLKEVGNCLTTSKELIRVLNHVLAHEDNNQSLEHSKEFQIETTNG